MALTSNDKAVKGKLGEDFTADYLIKNGYDIITRNYRKPCGEIDIIATKGDILAFVEVKTRKYRSLVSGAEAVGYKKKGRIIATADIFLADYDTDKTIRYDIADVTVSSGTAVRVIDFNYYEDAFDTTGYETQF